MKTSLPSLLLAAAALAGSAGVTSPAHACGGFFCSQAQPVNQAAERIIFADNGDGTVTAVIQILYEGPSENFSWLLPISTAPAEGDIAVASDLAFQRLQSATNPQYTLTTQVEGTCRSEGDNGFGAGGSSSMPGGSAGSGGSGGAGGGVMVEASGSVGPFDWTVISVAGGTEEPASAAVTWLQDSGYDVPDAAPGLLAPYLEDGLFLLALKLTKGSDTGSIRPIVLTYEATKAMIPVKLTAVAANDDMGVMTWLLGNSRAVPENYLSLELNEARINWFNAASNYESVVIEAANDSGGQGFVTEFAGPAANFASTVWMPFEEQQWQSFSTSTFSSFQQLFDSSYYQWNAYDGYWDAVREAVTLPGAVTFEDFKLCPTCYSSEVTYSPAEFVAAIEEYVIEPMRVVQNLIDAHPQMTRLYTTLSAEEMILDPLFTFNPDLPEVSNFHQATRIVECDPSYYFSQAPWRIELPQGSVVRGTADQAATQSWPSELDELPPNVRITRAASSGDGRLLEDNTEDINALLDDYNAGVPVPEPGTGGTTGGTAGSPSGGSSGQSGSPGSGGSDEGGAPGNEGGGGEATGPEPGSIRGSGGCTLSGAAGGRDLWGAALLGLAAYAIRRRTRRTS